MRLLGIGLCSFITFTALADEVPKGAIAGVVLDKSTGTPVAGATAIVSSTIPSPAATAAQTDPEGHFRFPGLVPGTYNVLILYGATRDLHERVPVSAGITTPIHGELVIDPETITIREQAPVTLPKPVSSTVKRQLPYSDEAVDGDTWSVGWLLLDIDTAGKVAAFQFLHRPGHGLDKIATSEVWNLRFKPATDAKGKPVVSQLLWKMEWPSYWWLKEVWTSAPWAGLTTVPVVTTVGGFGGRSGQGARAVGLTQRGGFLVPPKDLPLPPCEGQAPLNLESVHPVYRDCSQPDLETAANEPAISRPRDR